MAETRQLRLRARQVDIVTATGPSVVQWESPDALMLVDNVPAIVNMHSGTSTPTLRILFDKTAEVIFPRWKTTGIELRLRGACVDASNTSLSSPAVVLRPAAASSGAYQGEARSTPLLYADAPTPWYTLGGPGDLWGIPNPLLVDQDAGSVGLAAELSIPTWTDRTAKIELDAVELILHLEAIPFPGDTLPGGGVSRMILPGTHVRGTSPPADGAPRSLWLNTGDPSLWTFDADGSPVRLI